ncbi:MAG TPA: hypothetical protein VM888_08460, partial [Chitinophagaceae bacterium]|nr:hypothetical protein [Chitinophagaceae bacterium]
MKLPLIKNSFSSKLLVLLLIFGIIQGCQKNDNLPPKATEENADVVYQWYRFVAKLQQLTSPQPVTILHNRNFGYIGVGLYESVQPGIKNARSLATVLHLMPTMPQPDLTKNYLWSASANAALASMFKQFLTGLSDANRVSIDSMEAANNNRFKLTTSDDILLRSQAFGR